MEVPNYDDTSSYYTDTTVPHKSLATECLPPANQCDTPTDRQTSTVSSQTNFSSEGSDSEVWCCGIRKRRKPKDRKLLIGRTSKSDSPFDKLSFEEKKTFMDLIKEPPALLFGVTYDQLKNTESDSGSDSDSEEEDTTIDENERSMCPGTESKCHCDQSDHKAEPSANYQSPHVVTNQFSSSCSAAQHTTTYQHCSGPVTKSIITCDQEDNGQPLNWESKCVDYTFYQNPITNYSNQSRCMYESGGLVFPAQASIERLKFPPKVSDFHHQPAPLTLIQESTENPKTQMHDSVSCLEGEPSQSTLHGQQTVINTAAPEDVATEPRSFSSPDISETIQVSPRLSSTNTFLPWQVEGCGGPFKGGLVAASRMGTKSRRRTQIRMGQRLRIVPKT